METSITCSEHLAKGAGELNNGAEGCLETGPDGTVTSLEGGAVGRVESGEAGGLLGSVTDELDEHPPGVGGQGDGGSDLISEA